MGVVGADDAAERLTELILAACSEVVGPELSRRVLALPKERVRPSPKASAGGADYRCHAPVTVFRKLDAMTRASHDATGADAPEQPAQPTEPGTMRASRRPDGAIDVVVVSALGVARHRTYADATQIADAVIEAMDPRALRARRRRARRARAARRPATDASGPSPCSPSEGCSRTARTARCCAAGAGTCSPEIRAWRRTSR